MHLFPRQTAIYLAPWLMLAGLLGAWYWLAEALVPRVIAHAYAERSLPTLNRIIKDRTRPVEFYLQEWHQRRKGVFGAALAVAGTWTAGAMNLFLWLRRRSREQGRLRAKDLDWAILLLTLAAAAGLFFLLVWPLLTGHVYLYDDLGFLHLPLRSYYARSLQEGQIPTWCPGLFCGFDAHGEGQGGFFHPLKLFLYGLFPLVVAFNIDTVLAYPVAFAGMWLFLRRWRVAHGPAALGAFTFTLSAYLSLRLNHTNVIQILAHWPWLLWCIDILLQAPRPRQRVLAGAGVALLTASQLLLGYPPSVWYTGLAEAVYAISIGWGRGLPGKFLLFVGMKMLGVLLGAVQVLPTLATIALSQRAKLSLEGLATDSLIPWNFFQWISPFAFSERTVGPARPWEFAQYAGLWAPVALVWVLVERRLFRRYQRVLYWAGAMVVFGAIFALGQYGPVFYLLAPLPPWSFFRSWARYSVWIYGGLSVAVALAFQLLLRQSLRAPPREGPADRASPGAEQRSVGTGQDEALPFLGQTQRPVAKDASSGVSKGPAWRLRMPMGLLVLLSALLVLLARWKSVVNLDLPWATLLGLSFGPIGLLAVWWLFAHSANGKRWAFLGLTLFHLADLAWYDLSYWLTRCRFDRLENFLASIHLPPGVQDQRLWTEPGQEANVFLLTDLRSAGGWWGGLVPRQSLPYPATNALRIAGVACWKKSPLENSPWQPVPEPLPEIRLVAQAVVSSNPAQDLDRIDPARMALVDRPVVLETGPFGKAVVLDRQPGYFRIQTHSPTRQLLIVAETWHPRWTATVDGQPSEILRAYGDFMAVPVGPGTQQIILHWQPTSLRWGILATATGLVLLGLWIGLGCIQHPIDRMRRFCFTGANAAPRPAQQEPGPTP